MAIFDNVSNIFHPIKSLTICMHIPSVFNCIYIFEKKFPKRLMAVFTQSYSVFVLPMCNCAIKVFVHCLVFYCSVVWLKATKSNGWNTPKLFVSLYFFSMLFCVNRCEIGILPSLPFACVYFETPRLTTNPSIIFSLIYYFPSTRFRHSFGLISIVLFELDLFGIHRFWITLPNMNTMRIDLISFRFLFSLVFDKLPSIEFDTKKKSLWSNWQNESLFRIKHVFHL